MHRAGSMRDNAAMKFPRLPTITKGASGHTADSFSVPQRRRLRLSGRREAWSSIGRCPQRTDFPTRVRSPHHAAEPRRPRRCSRTVASSSGPSCTQLIRSLVDGLLVGVTKHLDRTRHHTGRHGHPAQLAGSLLARSVPKDPVSRVDHLRELRHLGLESLKDSRKLYFAYLV